MGAVIRGKRTDTAIDTITGVVMNSWGDSSVEYPQNIWFDGGWDNPQIDNPAIIRGLSQYAALMSAGPEDIPACDWNGRNGYAAKPAAFFRCFFVWAMV